MGLFLANHHANATPRSGSSTSCHSLEWARNSARTPYCPPGNNTILPENFPAMAYVISDQPALAHPHESAKALPEVLTLGILQNSDPNRLPLILIPTDDIGWERITASIQNNTTLTPLQRTRYLHSLVHVNDTTFVMPSPTRTGKTTWSNTSRPSHADYTWQQDYFESFINPATGMPVLRRVRDYPMDSIVATQGANELFEAAQQACSWMQPGPDLIESDTSGTMGGNIEGLPGGLCLHGDNQRPEFARQYCGDPANEVIVNTKWLQVGHVDEIVHVLPRPGASPPCNFAMAIASPQKALELLKQNPTDKFFEFYFNSEPEDLNSRFNQSLIQEFCSDLKSFFRERAKNQDSSPGHTPSNVTPQRGVPAVFWLFSLPQVEAKIRVRGHQEAPEFDCKNVTHAEVAAFLEGDQTASGYLNRKIQNSLAKTQQEITEKIHSRLPQCEISWVQAPNLFLHGRVIKNEQTGEEEIPNGMVHSLTPNPSNSLNVNATVFSPHPMNGAFARHLESSYRSLGLRTQFVDTFEYAHIGMGNLHCATHMLPFCRPSQETRR